MIKGFQPGSLFLVEDGRREWQELLRRHEEAVREPWGICEGPWRSNGDDVRGHGGTVRRSWEEG